MRPCLSLLPVAAALSLSPAHADILVALAGPMTGANAAFGEQLRQGATQAVADINAQGGLLGQKLVLTIGDDACDPKQAVAIANQLASQGVVFVAGHFCSGSSIPASAIYNDAGILQITPGSTAAALTDEAAAKGWTNVYRACGRDDQQGKVIADYVLAHDRGKVIALIDDKSAYGKGLATVVRTRINAEGVKEAVDESITAGDQDFSALISKLKLAHTEVVFFGGYQKEAALIVRQAREQGLQAQIISDSALPTREFWDITGPAGNGTLFTFYPNWRNRPSAKAVVASFEAAGKDPEGFTLLAYTAIQIFAQAATKAGSTKLADLAPVLHRETFETVTGPIQFDLKGDLTQVPYVFWEWRDGAYHEL